MLSSGARRVARAVVGLAAAVAWASPSRAADGPWSATVGVVSDYVLRGVDQTYGGAALQAGVSYQSPSGWFGGVWLSNVEPYPYYSSAVETDLYGGYGWRLGRDYTARVSYTRYLYAFDKRPRPYDYGELSASLSFRDLLTVSLTYDPDTVRFATEGYRNHRRSLAYEVAGRWPLHHGLSLNASAGYYDLTDLYGIAYWSGAAGASWTKGRLTIDLNRFYSEPGVYRLYDESSVDGRWVVGASWRF